ncbi:GNAT family N-acetyltransferase [Shewanella sp. KX20019]|uniref:GNAT family N-acetyltransferase n=1 Tax=Shewanella sp. KX20019 TaxID=2803864 RepID=UPI0019289612|nr:GNAT family N-acetyltransferase [Shewanella sp. KX20019]QQX81816.1 GNAT family N-acetyltransferase [Shewanella sp. KX20019]
MMINLLDLSKDEDVVLYRNHLVKYEVNEPYYKFEFFTSFSKGTKNLYCLIFEENDSIGIYPFYMNVIPLENNGVKYYDIASPYGYSGPLFVNMSKDQITAFWILSDNFLASNNVVSEFVRFSLDSEIELYNGIALATLSNVKGNIVSEEELWTNSDHKVRKNVKRALREHLRSEIYIGNEIDNNVLAIFHDIYINTMKRTNADISFMYTPNDFFDYIRNNIKNSVIITVYDDLKAVSTELLLISDNTIYSFLGGTLKESFSKRPNDFLKYVITNWAREQGISYFVLGGGYGKDDGIFEYKKAFFPSDIVSYYTGRKVLNSAMYDEVSKVISTLVDKSNVCNEEDILELKEKDYFPCYSKFYKILS